MSDIFREVDEALQQEKLQAIWKKYGSLIIMGVLALILSTAGFSGFNAWKKSQEEKQTSRLIAALEVEDKASALSSIIDDAPKDYANIAVLAAAGSHLQLAQYDEALAIYKDAIENKKISGDFADLARLMTVRIQMGIDQEKSEASALLDMLAPSLKNTKSAWINHVRVEAALIEAHYNANYTKSLEYLDAALADETLPNDLKTRAEQMRHVYALQNDITDSQNEG